jgi:hypothetical protein
MLALYNVLKRLEELFEVLKAVKISVVAFWIVTTCGLVDSSFVFLAHLENKRHSGRLLSPAIHL